MRTLVLARSFAFAFASSLLATGLLATGLLATGPASRPNIVYIMADELGYYELSHMGHPYIETPHIDRLAASGVRFTRALAGSSLCAPTRGVLMTGKHSGHTSVRSNGGGTPLRAGEETVASVLKRVGYATGGFGKWGCGGRGSTGVPEKHGFDTFVGYYDQVHAHSYYPPYLIRNSEELVLEGNDGGREGKTYSHYVIFDEAKKFIRANQKQPFLCYLPVTPPHGLFDLPEDDPAWTKYRDRSWPREAARYAAMVTMLDRQVGELIALLEELKLRDNTLIFFCGDNGGNDYFKDVKHPRGFHAPNVDPKTRVEFRGQKGRLYEGGLRIPMIANWPGKIAPGRVSDHLWYFPDVLPTLTELAGAKAPGDIDGISIVPELLGEKAAGRKQKEHEYLYWELGGQVAVRQDDWKAIRPSAKKDWELYDLAKDPSETKNLAALERARLERMKAWAEEAHEPVVEGTFADRTFHEKDRRAKWGNRGNPAGGNSGRSGRKVKGLPRKGLVSSKTWKLLRASSESTSNGKLAKNAFDRNPHSIWHSAWQEGVAKHPHELEIDLGRSCRLRGLRYLSRQDAGWNGAIAKFELYVSDSKDAWGEPVLKESFAKTKSAQEKVFQETAGRFVKLRVLSEVNGGPWASVAELGLVGKPVK